MQVTSISVEKISTPSPQSGQSLIWSVGVRMLAIPGQTLGLFIFDSTQCHLYYVFEGKEQVFFNYPPTSLESFAPLNAIVRWCASVVPVLLLRPMRGLSYRAADVGISVSDTPKPVATLQSLSPHDFIIRKESVESLFGGSTPNRRLTFPLGN
jgi:hypothetical protein